MAGLSIIAALDLGTTRIKGALFTPGAVAPLAHAQRAAPPVEPDRPGGAAQRWTDYEAAIGEVLDALTHEAPAVRWSALGVTAQRGCVLPVVAQPAVVQPEWLISWLDAAPDRLQARGIAKDAPIEGLLGRVARDLGHPGLGCAQTWPPEIHEAARPRPQPIPPGHRVLAGERHGPWQRLPTGLPVILAGGDKHCELIGAISGDRPLQSQAVLSLGTAISLGWLIPSTHPPPGLVDDQAAFVTPAHCPGWHQVEVGLPGAGQAFAWLGQTLRWDQISPEGPPGADAPICVPDLHGRFGHPEARGAWLGLSPEATADQMALAWVEGVIWTLACAAEAHRSHQEAPPLDSVVLCGGGAAWPAWSALGAPALGGHWSRLVDEDVGLRGVARVVSQRSAGAGQMSPEALLSAARAWPAPTRPCAAPFHWPAEARAARRARFEAAAAFTLRFG